MTGLLQPPAQSYFPAALIFLRRAMCIDSLYLVSPSVFSWIILWTLLKSSRHFPPFVSLFHKLLPIQSRSSSGKFFSESSRGFSWNLQEFHILQLYFVNCQGFVLVHQFSYGNLQFWVHPLSLSLFPLSSETFEETHFEVLVELSPLHCLLCSELCPVQNDGSFLLFIYYPYFPPYFLIFFPWEVAFHTFLQVFQFLFFWFFCNLPKMVSESFFHLGQEYPYGWAFLKCR